MIQHSGPANPAKRVIATITFDGTANKGQSGTNTTLFTTTGRVLVLSIVPFCTTGLGEAGATATVSLGVTSGVADFIAAVNSVDIDTNEFWVSATPTANSIALPAALKDIVIADDILIAAATQNTNAGTLEVDVYWMPLSDGANLVTT